MNLWDFGEPLLFREVHTGTINSLRAFEGRMDLWDFREPLLFREVHKGPITRAVNRGTSIEAAKAQRR